MLPQPKTIFIVLIFFLSGLLGFVFSIYQNANHSSALKDETQVIETFHSPEIFVKQLKGDKQAGKKIFYEFCASCHSDHPLIDIQAPHVGDKKVWRGLRTLGMDKLLEITTQGKGAMPARGGCFECSDEQLRETIKYILKGG